jgi:hypothetical protein
MGNACPNIVTPAIYVIPAKAGISGGKRAARGTRSRLSPG